MKYIIGVGSNLGNRELNISNASIRLQRSGSYTIISEAPVYENPAMGGPTGQMDFLNTAWLIDTRFGPHQCLHELQRIERELGRVRNVIYGQRCIDLDLLMCDQMPIVDSKVLQIPHPRLHQRLFVLYPVNAIAPEWTHPIVGHSMTILLKELNDG